MEDSQDLEPRYLKHDELIFDMFQHYWKDVLHKEIVEHPGFKVACIGTGDSTEALPISLALEGKTLPDIRNALAGQSSSVNVEVFKFDIDLSSLEYINRKAELLPFVDIKNFAQADYLNVPVVNEAFDVVVMRNPDWSGLRPEVGGEYIPWKVAKLFGELERILKPNGILWMTFVLKQEFQFALKELKKLAEKNRFELKVGGKSGYIIDSDINLMEEGEDWPYDQFILIAERK